MNIKVYYCVFKYVVSILLYLPCIVYNLLYRPTNALYINSNVYFMQYFNTCQFIDIILREYFIMYARVTMSVKLIQLKCL